MKKIIYIFALVVFVLTSCNKNEVEMKQNNQEPAPPVCTSKLPRFPAEVLFVLGREYETIKDGTSEKVSAQKINTAISNIDKMTLNQYVENRLIELYPEEAYVGLANDMEVEGLQTMEEYENYLAQLKLYELSIGVVTDTEPPTPEFTSIEDEIVLMRMTQEEETSYRKLNSLAIRSDFATLDDFNDILYNTRSSNGNQKVSKVAWGWITAAGIVVLGTYAVIRAKICKERAENKQVEFYGGTGITLNSGTQNDAFKHIYVSMMLRRYLSEPAAWAIMDLYWENANENKPCDKYMDLHNNYLGRHSKYWTFRGHWLSDMHNWELWGERVKTFVNTSSNASKKTWTLTTIESTVKAERNSTNKSNYIYWKDGK